MTTEKIKALIIEDSEDDLKLMLRELNKSSYNIIYKLVKDTKGLETALQTAMQEEWDIIISDYTLPDFNGYEALNMCNEKGVDIPFFIVSGTIGERIAIDMMKSGAKDYIMKNNLARLLPAIEREIADTKIRKEKKRAEQELRESEERYRYISSTISDISYSCSNQNGSFCISWITGAVERIFGYTIDEMYEQQCWGKLVIEEDYHLFEKNVSVLTPDSSEVCELRLRHKNGNIVWIQSVAECVLKPEHPDYLFLFGGIVDITERKMAEENLKISEKKYRNLVENALIGVYTTNFKGEFLYANTEMRVMLEFDSIDELINTDVEIFYKNKDERKKLIETINESKQIFNYELELITKKGKSIDVILNSFISEETITGMMLDITERKQAEKEIIKAKEEAERLSRLKSNFLANMSHEIRTPLTGILGFSDIIQDEYDLEEVKNMVSIINESGHRLLNTLNQILDLSSLAAQTKEINYKLTDITAIIKETVVLFHASAKKKNLELTFESDIFPLMAYTEPDVISNTLNNIVNNAIIYTLHGSITVKAREEIINENECIVINVSDTGIGIEKKNLELIFDEFRQVSEGLGRKFEGTGLGLSLCRKYMNLLGGSVSVTSKPGEGSDFRLVIPKNNLNNVKNFKSDEDISAETLVELFKKQISQDSDGKKSLQQKVLQDSKKVLLQIKSEIIQKPKILYIEDEINCILLVKCVLENYYDVDTSANGAEGIEKTKNNEYALILLDINLRKGISGLEALSEIRKNPYYKDIPVIALTAFAMRGDEEEFRAAGCIDYISKPFEKKILMEKIAKAIMK